MVLKKDKVILPAVMGIKPNKFRFKGNLRLGFKNGEVVEIVKFKEVRS